jgi:hypothetical protein
VPSWARALTNFRRCCISTPRHAFSVASSTTASFSDMMATTLALLEQQKADLLARVAGWPSARLAYRLTPLAWSVVEVVDHLGRVEAGILAAAKAGPRLWPATVSAHGAWISSSGRRRACVCHARYRKCCPRRLYRREGVPGARGGGGRVGARPGATWRRSSPALPPPSDAQACSAIRSAGRWTCPRCYGSAGCITPSPRVSTGTTYRSVRSRGGRRR